MNAPKQTNRHDADAPTRPFVTVDEARKRPETIEELAELPDTGGLVDEPIDADDDDVDDDGETDVATKGAVVKPPN